MLPLVLPLAYWVCGSSAMAVVTTPQPPHETSQRLAPAIGEIQGQAKAVGVFYQHIATLTLESGSVILASTADGRGELRTDDVLSITVRQPDGSQHDWFYDFRDSQSGGIRSIPAQDLTSLFMPWSTGPYVITLTLIDTLPPARSSQPYFLRYSEARQPIDTPTPTPTLGLRLLASATPYPSPSPTNLPLAPQREISTQLPMPTTTMSPPMTTHPPSTNAIWQPWMGAFGLGLLFLGVGLSVGWRWVKHRHALRPHLHGYLTVHDAKTAETLHQVDLTAYHTVCYLTLDPLCLASPQAVKKAALLPIAQLSQAEDGGCRVKLLETDQTFTLPNAQPIVISPRLKVIYRKPPSRY